MYGKDFTKSRFGNSIFNSLYIERNETNVVFPIK